MTTLIQIMIGLGILLMVINVIFYVRFERQTSRRGGFEDSRVLFFPILLLVLFLAGYIAVWLFGKPDLIIAGILFGGSIFVFVMLQLMQRITEKVRQNEELKTALATAEQASEAKSNFLSNMSHDIRTPLNAIIGYTELARRNDLTLEEAKESLGKIGHSGRQLLMLVNDILEMRRIESGRSELNVASLSLPRTMEDMYDLFAVQMKEKKITYTVETAELADPYVLCDENRLHSILLNLIGNALKFTPEGGHVAVSLQEVEGASPADAESPADAAKHTYELRVRDDGIGMTKEFAEKVFDAFERERTSTVSKTQGTGLGMAITKSHVELMGGTIEVASAPGEGTEFVVRLPLAECDQLCRKEEEEASAETLARLAGKKALLVEDMEINQEIMLQFLQVMGISAAVAGNGAVAVETVAGSHPGEFDVILMDIQMPVMDGYEAARAIRSLPDPDLSQIPIIAVSANVFDEDRQKAVEAGMNGSVGKPVDPRELSKVLAEILP